MNEEKENKRLPSRKKGGRKPKTNPAVFRYTVNFNAVEHARVFSEEFRVVRTDRAALEYVAKLTALYQQFRSVGVNYNQVVKELHVHFSEKKALAMLYKLEETTMELIELSRKIVELSNTFENQWLRK